MTKKARSSGTQKHRTQASQETSRLWLIVGGIALVVVAAAVIAVALASSQPSLAEPAEAKVIVTGGGLPEYPDSGGDPAIGLSLPSISGTDLGGAPMTISADGRAKAIVILAHWCPHCMNEVPRIVEWLENNPVPEGVDVVGLSTAIDPARPNYPPSEWLDREGWEVPTINDDASSTAYYALGGMATPGWVFVAADGTIQGRTTGELDPDQFSAILEQLAP